MPERQTKRGGERADPPDRASAARIIRRLAATAGIERDITPHGLRRTFVTTGLLNRIPLYDMQRAARHMSPSTTTLYDMAQANPDRDATHQVAGFMASLAG